VWVLILFFSPRIGSELVLEMLCFINFHFPLTQDVGQIHKGDAKCEKPLSDSFYNSFSVSLRNELTIDRMTLNWMAHQLHVQFSQRIFCSEC
jgi:hypothetical protein